MNFKDERYIPFEDARAISSWRLSLPDAFRQFDYSTIINVIMQVRYTSVDGGDKFDAVAARSVTNFIEAIEDISSSAGLFIIGTSRLSSLQIGFASQNPWLRRQRAQLQTGA
jgi:hypothetical protein